ncbi:MAG: hypothetical protein PHW13_12865, partial [Methylococcales bacterium]|nr:hypothetical protein [Methylococcales bacterium]
MRRPLRWLLWILGGLLLVPAVMLALNAACNSSAGRTAIRNAASGFSGGQVVLADIGGHFPERIVIGRVVLSDADGPWLTVDDLLLDWRPLRLLAGELSVRNLQAASLVVVRWPAAGAESQTTAKPSLPLAVNLQSFSITRLEMPPAAGGQAEALQIGGQLRLSSLQRGEMEFHARRLTGEGRYDLQASLSDEALAVRLSLHETAQGPLAALAGLTYRDSLNLEATLAGPLATVRSRLDLQLDELKAEVDGEIDFIGRSAGLTVTAAAPAMRLRQNLAWRTLALNLRLQGPFAGLDIDGGLNLDGLDIGGTTIGGLRVKLQGDAGRLTADGELAGLRLPGSERDALHAAPLVFQAGVMQEKTAHAFTLELKHPLIAATGQGRFQDNLTQADLNLSLPDLQTIAAPGGLSLQGHAELQISFDQRQAGDKLAASGALHIRDGQPWAGLLGENAKFDLALNRQGQDVTLAGLHLDGQDLSFSAAGDLLAGRADFAWQAHCADLSVLVPGYRAQLAAQGRLSGAADDPALSAELHAEPGGGDDPLGPLAASVQLENLLQAAHGRISLDGSLLKSPLAVQLTVGNRDRHSLTLAIDKADWKSAHISGDMLFSADNPLPAAKIGLKIGRLADFQAVTGQPLTGSASASLETLMQNGRPLAKLKLDAVDAGLAGGATIAQASLQLDVSDPLRQPRLNGRLELNGLAAGQTNGSAQIVVAGAPDALNLHLSANLPNPADGDLQVGATALLNAKNHWLRLDSMQASRDRQSLRLLSPAKFDFDRGLGVDRLRLGLQQAELDIGGRFSPDLAISAELQPVSANLLNLFLPGPALTGTLHAQASLHGSLSQPQGHIRFAADKLQIPQYPGS